MYLVQSHFTLRWVVGLVFVKCLLIVAVRCTYTIGSFFHLAVDENFNRFSLSTVIFVLI